MANHASAEKRNRQNIKRRERNRHVRTTVRTFIKRVRTAIDTSKKADAQTALKLAIAEIDRAVSKGVYAPETGSRYVSRLSKAVHAIK